MVSYHDRMDKESIEIFEKKYPWFKDLEADRVGLTIEDDGSNAHVLSGTYIIKGTIPKNDIIFDESIAYGTTVYAKTTSAPLISTAETECDVIIDGGTFTDMKGNAVLIRGGTFLNNIKLTHSVVLFKSAEYPKFIFKSQMSSFAECSFDEVSDKLMKHAHEDAYYMFGSGCVIDNLILDDNMVRKSINMDRTTINHGVNKQTNGGDDYMIFNTCDFHDFHSLVLRKNRFIDCDITDSEIHNMLIQGKSTIRNTKCKDCSINVEVGMRITAKNAKPPVKVMFANSSWDGGLFQGIFNQDSTWVSGAWYSGHVEGGMDMSLFGFDLDKDEIGDGEHTMAIPSLVSPKDNPELFGMLKMLSERFNKLYVDDDAIMNSLTITDTFDKFNKLCGTYSEQRKDRPMSDAELIMMGLTNDEIRLISQAMDSRVG